MEQGQDAAGGPLDRAAEELQQWLSRHEALCPVCGYNLHRLPGERCPECDAPVRLGVLAPRPRLFWALLVVSPCIFSGIAGVLLLGIALLVWYYRGNPAPWFVWATDAFGLSSGLVGLGLVYGYERGPMLDWRWPRQAAFAGAVWAVHLLAFGLVVLAF